MTVEAATPVAAGRRTLLRQRLVPAWAILACVVVGADAPASLRAPVVVVFLCVVPGVALVGLLAPDSLALELALAVGLSVAVTGMAAAVLLYAHLWSPTAVVLIVGAISVAAGVRDTGLGRYVRNMAARLEQRLWGGLRAVRRVPAVPAALPRRVPRMPLPSVGLAAAAASAAVPGVATAVVAWLAEPRRRPPRSLAQPEPQESADLLSLPALQRFVTLRVVRQVDPELWFVDELERRLRRQTPLRAARPATRGVWVTGVSAETTVPVAWRVLEEGTLAVKGWRARLALEALDSLSALDGRRRVVAAEPVYGSLSGFRSGLEARGLSYLLRVDAVTAARVLAPTASSRRGAEAREVVRRRLAGGVPAAARMSQGDVDGTELVLLAEAERLLLCEVPASGQVHAFWLSNLPTQTPPERLASLVRLASRHRAERARVGFLGDADSPAAPSSDELQHGLELIALAEGLRALDPAGARAAGAVEA